jgi:formate hydrogenlyase subunit 4
MNSNFENLFYGLWQKISDYLPNLLGGIILLVIGWVLAWIIKRFVIQILAILRFDRLLSKFRFSFS